MALSSLWHTHLKDRLAEPLHLNAIALLVRLFGGYETRIEFDLIRPRPYAFGLLHAVRRAQALGVGKIYALEFGVASGRSLIALARIAAQLSRRSGVAIEVVGFDSGGGLPPLRDYRDHPEYHQAGDFPAGDSRELERRLPPNARMVWGDIAETVHPFRRQIEGVIGFVAIDVNLYTSARHSLAIFLDPDPTRYLPTTPVWFDDINEEPHNPWCGELLAIDEFNAEHRLRKLTRFTGLRDRRIFKRANWLNQIYTLHVLDHPLRSVGGVRARAARVV